MIHIPGNSLPAFPEAVKTLTEFITFFIIIVSTGKNEGVILNIVFIILAAIIYVIYFLYKNRLKQYDIQNNPESTVYSVGDLRLMRKLARKKAKMLIERAKARLDKSGCIQGFKVQMTYDETKMQLAGIMTIPSSFSTIADCTIKYTGGTRKTVMPGSIPLTGDPNFDYRLIIEGLNDIQLLALFGEETRAVLLKLIRDTGRFTFTSLQIEFFIPTISIDDNNLILLTVFDTFITLAKKLLLVDDVKKKLLLHSSSDSCPGVRLNNLKALYEYYSIDSDIKNRLIKALYDPGKEVCKFAMECLGEEGIKIVYEFIKGNPKLSYYHPLGIINVIELLADSKGEKCCPVLINYFYQSQSSKIQKSIIKILAKIKGPEVEKFFIKILHSGSNQFIEDVIASLSRCGTAPAVMPLLDYAKKLFITHDLKIKARRAAAQIQSRLGPYEKGMLTITETDEMDGALSFSDQDEKPE